MVIWNDMSLVMRKPAFCICENKDAGNCAADQRLCFRYTDSRIPLLPRSLAIFCGCAAWFVSDLVGKPEDRFSQKEAHILIQYRPCLIMLICLFVLFSGLHPW